MAKITASYIFFTLQKNSISTAYFLPLASVLKKAFFLGHFSYFENLSIDYVSQSLNEQVEALLCKSCVNASTKFEYWTCVWNVSLT